MFVIISCVKLFASTNLVNGGISEYNPSTINQPETTKTVRSGAAGKP